MGLTWRGDAVEKWVSLQAGRGGLSWLGRLRNCLVVKELGDLGPRRRGGVFGEDDEYGRGDLQDRKLEGSRWLASAPGQDSGVTGWRGTEGGGSLPGYRREESWAKELPVERPEGLARGRDGTR